MLRIKERTLIEFIFWLVSYLPIILIIIYKYTIQIGVKEWYFELTYFIGIVFITAFTYKITLKIFLTNRTKQVKNSKQNKKLILLSKNPLSLEQYSFFILSLMMPFIFESTQNLFDLTLILSLILILIIIMIKMNQIIVNPIFLFSKVKIFKGEIEINGSSCNKNVAIITELTNHELETEEVFKYEEYFNNVYFLVKAK